MFEEEEPEEQPQFLLTNDNPAWKILTEEEKMSLILKHAEGKSTWEGGEIAGRSHYKYLEITGRAEMFFKMFVAHFKKYDNLIPDHVELPDYVKEYFEHCILHRVHPTEAYKLVDNRDNFHHRPTRERILTGVIKKLKFSKLAREFYLYCLLADFDRWNNRRIFPENMQEPHAFKRRQKNKHKKLLNVSIYLGKEKVERLSRWYKEDYENCYYAYLIEDIKNPEYEVIPIKKSTQAVREFSENYVFVFKTWEEALGLVSRLTFFLTKNYTPAVKEGQRFWPYFRNKIKSAVNYEELEGVNERRKEFLVQTRLDSDKLLMSKTRKSQKSKLKHRKEFQAALAKYFED